MTDQPLNADELRARIAQLEAENDRLRTGTTVAVSPTPPPPKHRGRWRPLVAVLLILFGCLLAPLSVVNAWAKATLTDTDRFVATYAPLAHDPAVQAYVVDQTMAVVNQNIDVNQLTSEAIDGIKGLGLPPRVSSALDLLKGPAASGLESTLRRGVTEFVGSDAFAQAWERALRISHTQLMATLGNDPNAIIAAQQDGTIGIQLGPIVADIKQSLVDRGVAIASRIPAVNKTIPVAQAANLPTAQLGYQLVVATGGWLPWLALILIAVGVVVAKHRARTLIWASLGFSLSMVVLLVALTTGRAILVTALPPSLVPSNVSTLLYDTATTPMHDTATIALVLGVVLAVVGWAAGPFSLPTRLRGFYSDGVGSLRNAAAGHGVTTGRVGTWFYAQRRLLHALVAVGATIALLLLRPLSVSDILLTLLVSVLALIVLSLVERPPSAPPALEAESGTEVADSPTVRL
ncbi:MAG TPA: hypothetical protein VFP34_07195 [Microlunatus sp.]|nr:hypothetical protein [Microlunatus sp.]